MTKAKIIAVSFMIIMLHLTPVRGEVLHDNITVDSVALTRQQEIEAHRAARGMVSFENNFLPKGQWIVGITASYSTHINDDYTFYIVEGINSVGYTLKASPIVAYAIKNNMAVGARFEYGRSMLDIDAALLSLNVGDDSSLDLEVNEYYAQQQSYTAMAIFRQYIPLGSSRRFALFSEMRLEAGYSQSKFAHDQPVTGTYSQGHSYAIGIMPGIVAFATNEIAFEVTVGMMGVGYSHTKQVHNQVYVSNIDSSSLSFKINILSIGLGVSAYF